MDIALRIDLLVPGAEYFGAPASQAEYENDVIWTDARPKPAWSEIAALDVEEQAAIDRQAALELLTATDADLARGVEDLIAALEAKGVIDPAADLPAATREKIDRRQAARAKL